MKKSITLLALALIASPAMADNTVSCKSISDLSANIMEKRQDGFPVSSMMEIVAGEDPTSKLVQSIVKQAYKVHRYSSDGMKFKAVQDFQNKVYMTCIE